MSKEILDQISEHGTPFIAFLLGIFFLVAAFVKGAISRRHRLRHEDAEAATANGGTSDAPVHLGNPFEAMAPAPTEEPPDPPPASASASSPATTPATATAPEETYVWE